MTQDPRLINGALSLVDRQGLGLCNNLIDFFRLYLVDQRGEWVGLSKYEAGNWLETSPTHARRLLLKMTRHFKILEARKIGGSAAHEYRFADPVGWCVKWRIDHRPGEDRTIAPELVRRRLEACVVNLENVSEEVVVLLHGRGGTTSRFRSPKPTGPRDRSEALRSLIEREKGLQAKPVVVQNTPDEGLQTDEVPSSRERGQQAPTPARDERQEEEEEPRGVDQLVGAARVVGVAILATGMGPVKPSRCKLLADAFREIDEADVGPVLAAIAKAADNDQKVPALVDVACSFAVNGLCEPGAMPPTPAPTKPAGRWDLDDSGTAIWIEEEPAPEVVEEMCTIAELDSLRAEAAEQWALARSEGDTVVAQVFFAKLRNYEERIARLEEAS
jgi:hypothetical protein